MRYTWAQFRSYLRLAHQRRAHEQLMQFVSLNRAMAGGNGANDFLDALKKDKAAADAAD